MNTTRERIRSTSRKISIALKVGVFFMLFVTCSALIGIVILTVSGEEMKQSFLAAFDVTAKDGAILSIVPQNLLVMFVSMVIYALFMCFILYFIYMIFRDISREDTPFCKKHILRMKQAAAMTIVLSVIGSFFDSLSDVYTIGEMVWHMDFAGMILGIVICCLALIFDYGCELQQQSDETL